MPVCGSGLGVVVVVVVVWVWVGVVVGGLSTVMRREERRWQVEVGAE